MGVAVNAFDEKLAPISPESVAVVNQTYHSILNVAKTRLKKFEKIPQLFNQLKRKVPYSTFNYLLLKPIRYIPAFESSIANRASTRNYGD